MHIAATSCRRLPFVEGKRASERDDWQPAIPPRSSAHPLSGTLCEVVEWPTTGDGFQPSFFSCRTMLTIFLADQPLECFHQSDHDQGCRQGKDCHNAQTRRKSPVME